MCFWKKRRKKYLRPPACAIFVSSDKQLQSAIVHELITVFILEGHCDYQKGSEIMLGCHLNTWVVMADIENIRHCTIRQVTESEYTDAGFSNKDKLLTRFQKKCLYTDPDAPVTVIKCKNMRGYLVDHKGLEVLTHSKH